MSANVKQAVLELARNLPDRCTWDELMYEVYVRRKIEDGLRAADEGRLVSHEDVFRELEGE